MPNYSARALATNKLQNVVFQPGHNFGIGDIVFLGGVSWIKSQANSLANCYGTCMVSSIVDSAHFVATQVGYIENITNQDIPLNVDVQYYVSPITQGLLTTTMPSTAGQVILPCFVADSATSGYFTGGSGVLVSASGGVATWVTVSANMTMAPNTGYVITGTGNYTLTIPASFAFGSQFIVVNYAGNFTIAQQSSQQITYGNQHTTTGSGGSLSSTSIGDTVSLVGAVANVDLEVVNTQGNLTFV